MKLDVIDGKTKQFYKEFLSIASQYKRIRLNPEMKPKNSELINYVTIVVLGLLLAGFIYFYYELFRIIYLVFALVSALFIFFSIFWLFNYYSNLKTFLKTEAKSELIVDNLGVELIKNSNDIRIGWEALACVIVTKRCIAFIPNITTNIIIGVPACYKEEVLNAINENCTQKVLIIDKNK